MKNINKAYKKFKEIIKIKKAHHKDGSID
jgi:hypothetical protein